jgi:hypothetical protein
MWDSLNDTLQDALSLFSLLVFTGCRLVMAPNRPTDGQLARLAWSRAEFCFMSDDCGLPDVRHPLWREDESIIYSYNCFWALPEQSFLCRSPAELTTIFYCLISDSPNLEVQIPVFISPRNRVAQLYPWTLGSLLLPLTTRRATVEVF